MRSLNLVSVMFAASVMASPMLDTRNLPEDVADHMHNHMNFHHRKRSENGPADQMIGELDKLFEESSGGTNPGWTPPESKSEAQPAAQPAEQEKAKIVTVPAQAKDVVYVTHTFTEVEGGQTPAPEAQPKQAVHKEHHEEHKPATKPQPQPAEKPSPPAVAKPPTTYEHIEKPAAKPAAPEPSPSHPASSDSQKPSTDGLPTTFVEGLNTESAVYKGLAALHHNIHRSNHSVPTMKWNETLFGYAKTTAESCVYGHSLAPGGGGYGQNIAAGNAPGNISSVVTNGFYNGEIELFIEAAGGSFGNDNPDMSNFEKWGHFTQIVWPESESFACYTATCSPPGADALDCNPSTGQSYLQNVGCGNGGTQAYNTVCNYYPPGNFAGQYGTIKAPDHSVPFVQMTADGVQGL